MGIQYMLCYIPNNNKKQSSPSCVRPIVPSLLPHLAVLRVCAELLARHHFGQQPFAAR